MNRSRLFSLVKPRLLRAILSRAPSAVYRYIRCVWAVDYLSVSSARESSANNLPLSRRDTAQVRRRQVRRLTRARMLHLVRLFSVVATTTMTTTLSPLCYARVRSRGTSRGPLRHEAGRCRSTCGAPRGAPALVGRLAPDADGETYRPACIHDVYPGQTFRAATCKHANCVTGRSLARPRAHTAYKFIERYARLVDGRWLNYVSDRATGGVKSAFIAKFAVR